MTKRIEVQLSDNILLVIIILLIISISYYSCSNKVYPYLNTCYFDSTNTTEQEMVLALEESVNGYYNLVDDGLEQGFRLSPSFVVLNDSNFIDSYNVGLLTLPLYSSYYINNDTAKTDFFSSRYLDKMFSIDSVRCMYVDYVNKKYNKKIKLILNKHSTYRIKSAIFRYSLYKIKAKVKFNGYSEIILPDFSESSSLIKRRMCKIYYIYDIRSIERLNCK